MSRQPARHLAEIPTAADVGKLRKQLNAEIGARAEATRPDDRRNSQTRINRLRRRLDEAEAALEASRDR